MRIELWIPFSRTGSLMNHKKRGLLLKNYLTLEIKKHKLHDTSLRLCPEPGHKRNAS